MKPEEMLEQAASEIRMMEYRRTARRRSGRTDPATGKLKPRGSRNRYIREEALVAEPIGRDGAELWIAYPPTREDALRLREMDSTSKLLDPDALNGYVAYPKRRAPLPVTTGGLAKYIPVHGGVTYAVKDSYAAVWGFDTLHFGSENVERTNPDWIRYQCAVLHHGLQVAAELYPKFRREQDPAKIAAMAESLFRIDEAASGSDRDRLGFGALLALLTGDLKR